MTAGGAFLPGGVWVTLAVAAVAAGILAFTRFGRHVVAVGSNELTARLCGVAVGRVKITVYALAGLLAGVAGLMEFATLTVGDPTDSIGLELEVIAAVVIGGGSLSGGQGSIAGSLVGALLLTVIKSGSTHVGLPNWVQEILTGFIIVVAMALDRYRRRERG
jgi:ribose transport system permease protein